MPITPVNKAKNTITPSNNRKGGYAFWGDPIVTWGDVSYNWGSPSSSFVNKVKNTITLVNKTKN